MVEKSVLKALLTTSGLVCLAIIGYGVYYTQQDKALKRAVFVSGDQQFAIHELSPDLTARTKNADLERDVQTIQADLDQIENESLVFETSSELQQTLATLKRISPEDKKLLVAQYEQAAVEHRNQKFRQLLIVYLNNAIIDRQTALSDKLLPRYQGVPQSAGQSKTITVLYQQIRQNINTMRNRNSETYFELYSYRDEANEKALKTTKEILDLAHENQQAISEVIPLIRAFELP